MPLPGVQVRFGHDGENGVWVDGSKLPGLLDVSVRMNGTMPVVQLALAPETLTVDLAEAGVQVVTQRQGSSAAEFADQLNPARLEALALSGAELDDMTQGEAFTAAVAVMAAEFDQAHNA